MFVYAFLDNFGWLFLDLQETSERAMLPQTLFFIFRVMQDVKRIRENPESFDKAMESRNFRPVAAEIIDLDAKRREVIARLQQTQSRRNEIASAIGAAKKNGEDAAALEREAVEIKQAIPQLEKEEAAFAEKLNELLASIPNIPLANVPVGRDETANVCVRKVGEPPKFDFQPKPHYEIGEALGMIDFADAVKISGSRFTILRSQVAKLERALKDFMLDVHTKEFGYEEIGVPFLVNSECMFGTGQLPKFAADSFQTTDGRWLIPTAEVSLTNMVRDMIIPAAKLPIRMAAYSACFRSEAGAAGRDNRGMIRNHQFSKVELVSVVHPKKGEEELERMTKAAETILKKLGLAYRVMLLSTGDMGFSAEKTYDLEVWIPSENTYREISSCSLCGQFQARRMAARYKDESEKGFVSTLNGSGLAIGRTIVAILENYQLANGKVTIPEVLIPYMNGVKELG
ncbi:MAG: serine--tRNA ligase [Holosporaceae bacterium]|jgi:seryl-tRNA synthetase|nr:serine--tRNA ligase [Holosporaceae bacterium]